MAWDPGLYLRYERYRRQPALDLMARIDHADAATIYDLGCGPGNVTALLADRWPGARVIGIDSSPEMLEKAADLAPSITWQCGDIAAFDAHDADVVFSNAALNWVPDHGAVVPRLFDALRKGGVLAIQVPRNYAQPSHAEIISCIDDGVWRDRLRPHVTFEHVQEPAFYFDLLNDRASDLELWETNYIHALEGEDPVLAWIMGTALRPIANALEEPERTTFLEEMRARYRAAYPPRPDGTTLFPMQRLFILARR